MQENNEYLFQLMGKPCKFFLQGLCKNGRNCQFFHQEVRRDSYGMLTKTIPTNQEGEKIPYRYKEASSR